MMSNIMAFFSQILSGILVYFLNREQDKNAHLEAEMHLKDLQQELKPKELEYEKSKKEADDALADFRLRMEQYSKSRREDL